MSGEIFTDSSMLEIFRAEVETHVESLTSGILALERDPGDTSHIDEMMRGAHSIKGAARIVGIDPAVRVAHVMEDSFVAAQNGKLTLRPEHVDVLLRGVDMLNRIANASQTPGIDWQKFDSEATPLVAEIKSVLAGTPASSPPPAPALSASAPVSVPTPGVPAPAAPRRPSADVAQPAGPAASSISDVVAAALSQPRAKGAPAAPLKPVAGSSQFDEITITLPPLFDTAAAELARRSFVAALNANLRRIRFDLTQTTDIDATGIAFLAAVPSHAKEGIPQFVMSGAVADLQQVLDATGIARLYPSEGR
ncbi:Hpt domain-containing protein [Schlesneria sp. T3-172]|uniref:Hpt domain-containing protein n=1 Tax=Schlesneria TaxID=656899 RepID=UPI002F0F0B6A